MSKKVSADSFEYKDMGLDGLIKLLEDNAKTPHVKVGILGSSGARDGAKTNAEVGAHHEFGTENLPIRSFLRMPISLRLDKEMQSANLYDEDTIRKIIEENSLEFLLGKIGVAAEAVVSDAFSTGGFGHWKKSNMAYKKVHSTLVETQQLRDSITSEVSSD